MAWGGRYEATMSHFVAWTLMCASKEGATEYGEKLSNYGKEILFFLLFGKENYRNELENWSVKSINVEREWKGVDILAEVTLSNEKKYVLLVEIKAYKHVEKSQLEKYKTAYEQHYEKEGVNEKFVVLGAWANDKYSATDKKYCDDCGFSIYTFQNIVEDIFSEDGKTFESSGNCLFDEFWVGKW